MTWSRATAIAGSAVVTLASCRIQIVRGEREPPRNCGTMAPGAGWLRRGMTAALTAASWRFWNGAFLMSSPVPIFDGHNDVLLRLYRRGGTDVSRAFLEGEAKGQLDLPLARQGGFVGGLFAIFVPSSDGQNGPNDETASQRVSSGALSAPAVEVAPAQRAVLSMVSLLLRIERESKGRVRICRNVT